MAKLKQQKGKKGGSGKVEKGKKSSHIGKNKNPDSLVGVKKKINKKKKFNAKKKLEKLVKESNKIGGGEEKKIPVENPLKRKLPTNVDENGEEKAIKKGKSTEGNRLMAIYELLRRKNTSKVDKKKLIEEVLESVKDKEDQVVFKHDTVRVLEHCMKYGEVDQRNALFELFKDKIVLLLTSAGYSKFLVKKFLEYGSKEQKAKIIASFRGKIRKLIRIQTAADILEEIFTKYANANQKTVLTEEFYGPEFAIFRVATGKSFDELMEKEPEKKESVMNFMKTQFIGLCQKDTILHSITHRALFQFFKYADNSQKQEVCDILKEKIIQILHTKDGAKVAINCLWLSTPKDRKAILKSFKTFVVKICKEEFGHLVMLALFDTIDDTVLVKKALFPEIIGNLQDLIADQYGRKVILYLLKPRSHSYFLPDIVKFLEQGDTNPYSKKTPDVRQEELRSAIHPELLKTMVPHVSDIICNKSVAIVLLAAIECSPDLPELQNLLEKIASFVSKPLETPAEVDDEESEKDESDDNTKEIEKDHPICRACDHWVIKSVIQEDKSRVEKSKMLFSEILCNTISVGSFADWATVNRGAFVLVSLLETGIESVTKRVQEDLALIPKDANCLTDEGKGFELLRKLINSDAE